MAEVTIDTSSENLQDSRTIERKLQDISTLEDDNFFIGSTANEEESVYSSDSDDIAVDKEPEIVESRSSQNNKGKKRSTNPSKRGRKAKWSDDCTDDLVDIICNNELYKRKLIFTNTKTAKNGEYYVKIIKELKKRCFERGETFTYDVNQTREKFKRCLSECKKASLTMKTASGIKRFQESKGYGKWFSCLLPLVQSRVSCQAEQALDPSSVIKRRELPSPSTESSSNRSVSPFSCAETEGNGSNDIDEKEDNEKHADEKDVCEEKSGSKDGHRMFVPVKRRRSAKASDLEESVKKALEKATESLEKDNMGDLLRFFERQNDLARQHELNLFSMMFGQPNQMIPPSCPQWQPHSTNLTGVQMGNQGVYSTGVQMGNQGVYSTGVQMGNQGVYSGSMVQPFQGQFQNVQQSFEQQQQHQQEQNKYFTL